MAIHNKSYNNHALMSLNKMRKEESLKVLQAMKSDPHGQEACIIGEVTAENAGCVEMETLLGGRRSVDWLNGEQLPRIC